MADSPAGALEGMTRLATDVVREMETGGETPPVPLATRSYSGKFMVRVPPETHRALLLAASEQGVSLNSLATARLAGTAGW